VQVDAVPVEFRLVIRQGLPVALSRWDTSLRIIRTGDVVSFVGCL
jgi:hypothetical protein